MDVVGNCQARKWHHFHSNQKKKIKNEERSTPCSNSEVPGGLAGSASVSRGANGPAGLHSCCKVILQSRGGGMGMCLGSSVNLLVERGEAKSSPLREKPSVH